MAESDGDSGRLLEAYHSVWVTMSTMGEAVRAIPYCERGIALYDPARHAGQAFVYSGHDAGACAGYHLARAAWLAGYTARAVTVNADVLALAERLGHPRTTVNALLWAALLGYWMGDHDGARKAAERAVAMARAHEFTTRIDDGLVFLACLEARRGDRRALDEVYTWLSRPGAGTVVEWRTAHLVHVAEFLSEVGDAERGLIALDAIAPEQRNAFLAPEIRRVRAQLLLRRNEADEAERQLREAIEMARSRSERTLELRATTSLARLWQ